MTVLAEELAALPSMTKAELGECWEKTRAGPVPNVPVSLLRPLLASVLQERRLGGVPAAVRRELMRAAEAGGETSVATPRAGPGTRLVREWNGQTIAVEVMDEGYSYGGKVWPSLSRIARAVTGTHCSGPRFFGLAPND